MSAGNAQLSVIIPTLNESASLCLLLAQLARQKTIRLQVIVADGGSQDNTPQLALEQGVELIRSEAGRGRQMNLAAAQAHAPYLLFLHADSQLTDDNQLKCALDALQQSITAGNGMRVAGHFRLKFSRANDDNALAYRYYENKSALNRPECTNGDQGFLLSRSFFNQLGGFDETLWFLEDQRLAERIRDTGRWMTLPGILQTSARRFEKEGLGRRMILSALIMNFHSMGLNDFFHRATGVYRTQERTGQLQLTPVFSLVHQLNREAGGRLSLKRWRATGRYVLGHAWQPFFLLDVLIGRGSATAMQPFLLFHDRIFRPLTRFAPFEYLTAGVTWVWYRISWAVFALLERDRD